MTMWRQVEQLAKTLPSDASYLGRRMYLAGLGAVAMAGNAGQAVADMLVEEGRQFYVRERKAIATSMGAAASQVGDVSELVEARVQQLTGQALGRLGMPTRKDVTQLAARVELLTAKVDALARPKRPRAKKGARHVR